jgi:hypothetical protein
MPHVTGVFGVSTEQAFCCGPTHSNNDFEIRHCPEDAEATIRKTNGELIKLRFTLTYLPVFLLDVRRLTLDDVDDKTVGVGVKIDVLEPLVE